MGHLPRIGIEFILVKQMLNYTLPKLPIEDIVSDISYNQDLATVEVDNSRLVLSKEAVKALGATPGDKISITYWNVDKETTFPLIGKDVTNGNRLTKSNTVSFRGIQNTILKEYGNFFKLVPFKNYLKLEKVEKIEEIDPLQEEIDSLNELNENIDFN